jgi:pyruvate,water dikinase
MLRPIDALLPSASRNYGGKAKNLAALVRAGFPVPMAYALSAEAAAAHYARVLPARLRPAELLRAPDVSEAALAEARALVQGAELDPDLCAELRRALSSLRAAAVEGVAVRSSSTVEDLEVASAAGLHVSHLNVRGEAALFDAVKSCFRARRRRGRAVHRQPAQR